MDVILQAADALAASSSTKQQANAPSLLKIQRRLDELNSKLELILSLMKGQKTLMMKIQKDKILETKTRSVIKLASKDISNVSSSSRVLKRTSKTSSPAALSSPSPSPSSLSSPSTSSSFLKFQSLKTKEYYDKYPEIKKKFWGVGPGRRSSSTLKKMDQLIAQLK